MFGTAASVAYARCGGSGNNALCVLASLASGFGTDSGNGVYVYNIFNAQTGFTQSGFQNSDTYTSSLENVVGGILGISGNALIGSAAILYSYSNFPNISESSVLKYLNTFNRVISTFVGGTPYSISQSGLEHAMRSFSVSGINSSLSSLPSGQDYQKAINYNWYDSSVLFANPNFATLAQNIKDSENQYYYLSGEVIFPTVPSGLNPCIEFTQTITTPTGEISFSVIGNTPCFRKSSYVGPVSGVKFFREFNDGPRSSGFFDSGTQVAYEAFDEIVLSYNDYNSNTDILYSSERDVSGNFIYLISGGQVDSPGFFTANNEYGVGHTSAIISTDPSCVWNIGDVAAQKNTYFTWADYTGYGLPFQNMHQGDNRPKWVLTKYCVGYDGFGYCLGCAFTGQLQHVTGWKFAPIQLKESLAKNYEFLQMNPAIDTGRVIKRVFNLNNNSGISPNTPYAFVADTGDGTLTCTGIVGPPQLNSNLPSLPGFAFYQTFDNITFPDYVSIVMRAAVESGGSYVISNFNLASTGFSGIHYPVFGSPALVPIYQKISSSGLSAYDDVTRKSLAIGDNFGGNGVSGIQTNQSNAGYNYTGYTYYQSGSLVNVNQLLANNAKTVGSDYSTINYVSGYTGVGGIVYATSQNYAYIITGDTSSGVNYFGQPIIYSYLPDGLLGAVNTGWAMFAPQPSAVVYDIQNNSPRIYGEVYQSQAVENFLPRYSSGPYLSYENSFLYPNAQSSFVNYNASANGFPSQISYTIEFQEETVTEVYCLKNKYGFTTYPKVIRAVSNSATGNLKTSMVIPFVPDNQTFNSTYSLSNTGIYPINGSFEKVYSMGLGLVDANYVPNIDFTVDPTLNSTIHSASDYLSTRWKCGVKINSGIVAKKMMTGVGRSGIVYQSTPAIKNLFWGYYGTTLTGVLNYTLPLFNLERESIEIQESFVETVNNEANAGGSCYQGNQAASWNGSLLGNLSGQTFFSGQDPIFYEYVGGRVGSGAENDGGRHSKGIVGDAWYDVNIGNWGVRTAQCADCPSYYGYSDHTLHGPENDSHVFVLGLGASGLDIYSKNLKYYPYYYPNSYKPYTSAVSMGFGIASTPRWLGSEYNFDVDLSSYFSIYTSTGSLYSSGINIGPFDRDVELCVISGNKLLPSGNLIVDGVQLTTDAGSVNINCYDNFTNVAMNSGIIPSEGGRSPYVTTFKIIPKGSISNINISGVSGSLIGFSGRSIMTMRPRTFDGGTAFQLPYANGNDYTQIFGDNGFTDFSRFINNGAESKFSLPYGNFDLNSLIGKSISYQTVTNQTLLYPTPGSDFTGIVPTGVDRFGNTTYPPNPTAYYWSVKAPSAFFTGIRDVTRVNFTIKQLSVSGVGDIPYQGQRIIIPSGDCIISGVFAYTGEAESAVVSDGIALSGVSGARSLSGLFQPLYVSDAMSRLPSLIFNLPSGSGFRPILSAPSYMKTRLNPFYITGGDAYVGVSPFSGAGYNAFLWPAWSDLALLNPEVVYEQMPPDDGNVFMGSYLTFSAAQGQAIGTTGHNLNENVSYKVIAQYGFIDSTSTNAIYNTGACIFSGSATQTTLDSGNLSGILTSEGNSLTMAINLKNYRT